MKLNKNKNFIFDDDILMTGNNVGKSLNQILGSTQNDVAKMKGWFAWAYNHGGLGGGTGGSGTTDTNNFNISIQLDGDTISNTGGDVLLNSELTTHTLQIRVLRGGSDSFNITVKGSGITGGTQTVSADQGNFIATFTGGKISANTNITISVENNNTNMAFEYKDASGNPHSDVILSLIAYPYTFTKQYFETSSAVTGTPSTVTQTGSINMDSYVTNGLMIGFKYNIAIDTIDYVASKILYTGWDGINREYTLSSLDVTTKGSGYIYLPLATDIKSFLSNKDNAGTYTVNVKLQVKQIGNAQTYESNYVFNDSLIPNSLYLKITANSGTLFRYTNDGLTSANNAINEEMFNNNGFSLNITPYNGISSGKTYTYEYHIYKLDSTEYSEAPFSTAEDMYEVKFVRVSNNTDYIKVHVLSTDSAAISGKQYYVKSTGVETATQYIEIENNITSGNITDKTTSSINVLPNGDGLRLITFKLINPSNNTAYYVSYYLHTRASNSDFTWYHGQYSPQSSYTSYYRKGIGAHNITVDKTLKSQSSADIYMAANNNINTITLDINENDYINGLSDFDTLLGLGIQYSKINNYDNPICSFNVHGSFDENHPNSIVSGSIFVYQNKVIISSADTTINNNSVSPSYSLSADIFIPFTEHISKTDSSAYHLFNLYKNLESHTIDNNNDSYNRSVHCYIDGDLDGVFRNFVNENDKYFTSITFYPGTYYVNMIESSYLEHSYDKDKNKVLSTYDIGVVYGSEWGTAERTFMTENDVKSYYYTYKQLLIDSNLSYSKTIWNAFEEMVYTDDNHVICNEETLNRLTKNTASDGTNNATNASVMLLTFDNTIGDKASDIGLKNTDNDDFLTWLDNGYQENETTAAKTGKIPVTVSYSVNGSGLNPIGLPMNKGIGIFYLQLQGSSTMSYLAKNFELYAPTNTTQGKTYLFSPNWTMFDSKKQATPNYGSTVYNTFLPESSFTLKGDVVDSSHTINDAIGKFVNDVTTPFADAVSIVRTIANNPVDEAVKYLKNCLMGIPMLLFVKSIWRTAEDKLDNTGSAHHERIYFLGIYNFNLGRKSSNNLGYNDLTGLQKLITDKQPTGNFTVYEIDENDNARIQSVEIGEIQGNDPYYDFSQYQKSILFQDDGSGMWGDFVGDDQKTKEHLWQMTRDVAIAGGEIFTLVGKYMVDTLDEIDETDQRTTQDAYGYGEKYGHAVRPESVVGGTIYHTYVPNFKHQIVKHKPQGGSWLYSWKGDSSTVISNYWTGDGISSSITPAMNDSSKDVINRIVNTIVPWTDEIGGVTVTNNPRIDLVSLSEYYTICMAFAMVDSVKKNLNMKSWEGGTPTGTEVQQTWYTAFYDMDTALGINNGGARIGFFAFSDYWNVETFIDSQNKKHINEATIWRDYSPATGENAAEYFDSPSTYLFALAKYANSILGKNDYYINAGLEMCDPSTIWCKFRQDTSNSTDNKYGALRNAKYFMDTYFNGYLKDIPQEAFNLDYKYKYLVKSGLGNEHAYNEKNDKRSGTGADNIGKFWGRKNAYIEYWLNGRLHIMDAYMNINKVDEVINKTTEGIEYKASMPAKAVNQPTSNSDVYLLHEIFGGGSAGKQYPQGTRTIEITANEYTPLIVVNAGKTYHRYLFPRVPEPLSLNVQVNGLETVGYLGSQQWQKISSINGFITNDKSFSVSSDYLDAIIGDSGICNSFNIQCPALKALSLTSNKYNISQFVIDGSNINFINLDSIDVSNTNADITIKDLTIKSVTAQNMTDGAALCLQNLSALSSCQVSGIFKSLILEAWGTDITLPSGGILNVDTLDISNGNISKPRFSTTSDEGVTINIVGGTMKRINLTNFTDINIEKANKLYQLNIVNPEFVKHISINIPDGYDASEIIDKQVIQHKFQLYVNSKAVSTENTYDLSQFVNLEYVSFTNGFETEVIFPNKPINSKPIVLGTSCFEKNNALTSIKFANRTEDPSNVGSYIYNDVPLGQQTTVFEIEGNKTFYNIQTSFPFNAFFIEENGITKSLLNITDTCNDLSNTFNTNNVNTINENDAIAFLNNIAEKQYGKNIMSISNMFRGCSINYDVINGIDDYKNGMCRFNLAQFVNCTAWDGCFSQTNVNFMNRYIFGHHNVENNTYDGLGYNRRSTLYTYKSLINSNVITTPDIFADLINNMDEYDASDTFTVVDNTGTPYGLVETNPFKINDMFVNQKNIKNENVTPSNLWKINGLNFAIANANNSGNNTTYNTIYYDLTGLFDCDSTNFSAKIWSTKPLYLESILNNNITIAGDAIENNGVFTNSEKLFINTRLRYVVNSINIDTSNSFRKYFNPYNMFNWSDTSDSLANLTNLCLPVDSQNKPINIGQSGLNMKKGMTYEQMQTIVTRICKLPSLTYISGIFTNAHIIVSTGFNEFFKWVPDDVTLTSPIRYMNDFAANMKMVEATYEGTELPIKISHNFLNVFKNIYSMVNCFKNWYVANTIPFDFFNQRIVGDETITNVSISETDTSKTGILHKFNSITYKTSGIQYANSMLAGWHMPFIPNYGNYADEDKYFDTELIGMSESDKEIKINTDADNAWRGKYAFHSYDSYNLDSFKHNYVQLPDGSKQYFYYDNATKINVVNNPEIQDALDAEKDNYSTFHYYMSNIGGAMFKNNKCVDCTGCYIAPDFLYGLSNTDITGIISASANTINYTGTIPKHMLDKFKKTITNVGSLFLNYNITPIYLSDTELQGIVEYNEQTSNNNTIDKHTYNNTKQDGKFKEFRYYKYIPDDFISINDYSNAFNFNLILPYHNDNMIEYFFVITGDARKTGTHNSLSISTLQALSNAWPLFNNGLPAEIRSNLYDIDRTSSSKSRVGLEYFDNQIRYSICGNIEEPNKVEDDYYMVYVITAANPNTGVNENKVYFEKQSFVPATTKFVIYDSKIISSIMGATNQATAINADFTNGQYVFENNTYILCKYELAETYIKISAGINATIFSGCRYDNLITQTDLLPIMSGTIFTNISQFSSLSGNYLNSVNSQVISISDTPPKPTVLSYNMKFNLSPDNNSFINITGQGLTVNRISVGWTNDLYDAWDESRRDSWNDVLKSKLLFATT